MQWISVKDELPTSKKQAYFTFCDDGEIHKDIWFDVYQKEWMQDRPMDYYGVYSSEVKFWIPFPHPPNLN